MRETQITNFIRLYDIIRKILYNLSTKLPTIMFQIYPMDRTQIYANSLKNSKPDITSKHNKDNSPNRFIKDYNDKLLN